MNDASAPFSTIYLIRHAEKPATPDPDAKGIDSEGNFDSKSLTPRGWRRAGAWAVYFAGRGGIASPDQIFASDPEKEKLAPGEKLGSHSKRPFETVQETADRLQKSLNLTSLKGDEQQLVDAMKDAKGVTLVCWQHEAIPAIAKLLAGANPKIPASWPGERFDVVWRLRRTTSQDAWDFDQLCPELLSGDSAQPIAADGAGADPAAKQDADT